MPNRLIHETSPYLLQHANNPVEWYPWGEEAFNKARLENKPLFVSIGYAACHWCHVMEHESFENQATAEILNRFFVSIKVDREERPDVDMIYMQAVMNMNGQGGWPLNVFLTPEGRPFYGGTYFPPSRRYGMPAFQEVLNSLAQMWREDPGKLADVSNQLFEKLQQDIYWAGQNKERSLNPDILNAAVESLAENYDWENGGWGSAPKFPAPMTIEFLLTQARRGSQISLKIASHALSAMNQGGLYDVVRGGFHRYSTDDIWLVPHFEKMLYDNAQLALAYLHAYQLTANANFCQTAEQTLEFILNELSGQDGAFFSSLDADSEGEEGKFYTWTREELSQIIDTPDFELFQQAFQFHSHGNFEGKIILRKNDPETLAEKVSVQDLDQKVNSWRGKLAAARLKRVRPATDDKVLVGWNALALQAFAEAARALGRPDYLSAAQKNAEFLLTNLYKNGKLARSWRNGKSSHNGTLEDYSGLIVALLALYQADFDPHWYQAAIHLAGGMIHSFQDPAGGFFLVGADQADLVVRPKDLQDSVTPSGNAQAVYALLLLAAFSGNGGNGEWYSISQKALAQVQDFLGRYPSNFAYWLKAFNIALGPLHQVAIVWPEGQFAENGILADFQKLYQPKVVIAAGQNPVPAEAPELLQERPPRQGQTTVYICHKFVCEQPLTDPDLIRAGLMNLA
jgi:uncharacterized protein YyaL (SSP411 family)